jgi:hypothetical protein
VSMGTSVAGESRHSLTVGHFRHDGARGRRLYGFVCLSGAVIRRKKLR